MISPTSPSGRPVTDTSSAPVADEIAPHVRLKPAGWRFDVFLFVSLVAVTGALLLAWRPLLDLDIWIRDFSSNHRPWWPDTVAANLERLGQGGPLAGLCLAVSLVFAWRRRNLEPTFAVLLAFFASYGTIGTMKLLFDRPMPYKGAVELFAAPNQLAYPSGHASNGILWYGMLIMMLAPYVAPWVVKAVRWGPPIIVGFTTVYLGHHWLTDVIGGVLIGVLIERLVRRHLWRRIPWLHRLLTNLDWIPWWGGRSGDTGGDLVTSGQGASSRQ